MPAFNAKITLMGLNEYRDDLFEYLELPEDMDRQLAIDTIMLTCEELEIVYPSFPTMKHLIGIWSRSEVDIWEKLFKSENFEYNPLEPFNVVEDTMTSGYESERENGNEKEKRSEIGEETGKRNEGKNRVESSSVSNDESRNSNASENDNTTDNMTESVAAYNSETFKNSRKTDETEDTSIGRISNENQSGTSDGSSSLFENDNREIENSESRIRDTENKKEGNRDLDRGTNKYSRTHGNMGSTSYQELIKEEREVANFCTYDFIAESFKEKFCVRLY